jgi:ADP-heptose:LPS heptosyltransferase
MKKKDDFQNIALICEGGIGKCLMGTAVVANIKRKYPDKKIIVLAGHPDVFMKNPHVHRVFHFNNPLNFYEDFIEPKGTLVIKMEPYVHLDYIQQKRHLIDVWCEMAGVPYEVKKPEVYMYDNEVKTGKLFLEQYKKPILLMQTTGGKIPEKMEGDSRISAEKAMYRRSLPDEITKKIIDAFKDEYQILSLKAPTIPDLEGAIGIWSKQGVRPLLAIIPYVKKIFAIDSFLQHACAAYDRQAVVVWGGTSPKCLGYESNINLTRSACPTPFCHRPNSYLFDILSNGQQWDCPHSEACLRYDPDEIIKVLKEQA